MSLISKYPVENPCEAASFEEAFRKNSKRLCFERDLAKDERELEKKEGKEPKEITDPAFWEGAVAGNTKAYEVFQEELKKAITQTIERMKVTETIGDKAYKSGFNSIIFSWQEALEKNDPSYIVYW